jgi:cell division protease FtsH
MITEHRGKLDRVVQALLERETLQRDEFLTVLQGSELPEREAIPTLPGLEGQSVGDDQQRAPGQSAPPRLEPGPA